MSTNSMQNPVIPASHLKEPSLLLLLGGDLPLELPQPLLRTRIRLALQCLQGGGIGVVLVGVRTRSSS
jgi:hypothetical protein